MAQHLIDLCLIMSSALTFLRGNVAKTLLFLLAVINAEMQKRIRIFLLSEAINKLIRFCHRLITLNLLR